MTDELQSGDRALLWLNGWEGITKTPVIFVGETPKRYRIKAISRTKLAGRCRYIEAGETALVPKRSLTKFSDRPPGAESAHNPTHAG